MTDQCIVCLNELEGHTDPRPLRDTPSSHSDDTPEEAPPEQDAERKTSSSLIACLVPCGHHLHDHCLKPWVERANSCPICRQSFTSVQLVSKLDGPVQSSYTVQERVQVADVDPSVLPDEFGDPIYYEDEPYPLEVCLVCGGQDNQGELLICDGCETCWHTYCVGLDAVPSGDFFCEVCNSQEGSAVDDPPPPLSHRPRTAGERRIRDRPHQIGSRAAHASSWAHVWQLVWDRLNLDLDCPFETDGSLARYRQSQRTQDQQRREFQQWQRRFEVAQRQGGSSSRFRETKPALLESHQERGALAPETQEERRAWKDLDKAREMETVTAGKRKRRSATTSPAEPLPDQEPERKLKRPKTRRAQDVASIAPVGTQTAARTGSSGSPSAENKSDRDVGDVDLRGPSFLQSLLKEAGAYTPSESMVSLTTTIPASAFGYSDERGSPRAAASPGSSPTLSNHYATSRAGSTVTSPSTTRPGSPLPLTSKVEPIFPAPRFSQSSSPPPELRTSGRSDVGRGDDARAARASQRSRALSRSAEISPPRKEISASAKTGISKMVQAALKPFYPDKGLSKDDYTAVNRNVSRMLYERVGDDVTGLDQASRKRWEEVASHEVQRAVEALTVSGSVVSPNAV